EVFYPITNTWKIKSAMPTPRGELGAATAPDNIGTYGLEIFAIGGVNLRGYLNETEAYDPAIDTWDPNRAAMSDPRADLGVASDPDGNIYAVGGNNLGALDIVEIYNPFFDQWDFQSLTLNDARSGLSLVITSQYRVYAIGGDYDPDTQAH